MKTGQVGYLFSRPSSFLLLASFPFSSSPSLKSAVDFFLVLFLVLATLKLIAIKDYSNPRRNIISCLLVFNI